MIDATYHFPRGFLWGTATAAHQVEGNNTNNQWWKWEQDGHTDGTSGLACDWWGGRWREDFDRVAETGQKAHRLSVEWSRIQPAPDQWDEDALERYRAMLRGLHERGMTPMVTLHHFTDPLWLAESGRLGNRSDRPHVREVRPQDRRCPQGILHAVVHHQRAQRVRLARLCRRRLPAGPRRPALWRCASKRTWRGLTPPPIAPSTRFSPRPASATPCTTGRW